MQPIIMHVDMNSYFATVAQQDHPEWRGKPVGVCEHLGGIIIAASVEAKRWGIKTGTPVWEAKKLYPKIILTRTNPQQYRLYTSRLVNVVSDYTDYVEKYSIDEVFLDVSRVVNIRKKGLLANPFEEAAKIGREIQKRMKKEIGDWLTCSAGVGTNKLVAKIASDMQKPNGLVVILEEKTAGFSCPGALILTRSDLYSRLKLIDIPGIGRRQEKRLNSIGIRTLKDLRDYPKSHLVSIFGRIAGYHLHKMGQLEGSWKARVEDDENIKSVGHMYTLPKEFREKKFFVPVLYKLCEMVGKRLRDAQLAGTAIHCFLRDKNYEGFGQSKRLGYEITDGRQIFLEAMKIFELCEFQDREYKLIGVTMADLVPDSGQLSLFARDQKDKQVVKALDKINEKYGKFTVCRVPVLAAKDAFQDSVGFGRMKEFKSWKVKNS